MLTKVAGVLVFCMIAFDLLHDISGYGEPLFYLLAGGCSWAAALLLLPVLSRKTIIQVGVILLGAVLLLVVAYRAGGDLNYVAVLGKNASLVAMIASVGFLRLIALPGNAEDSLPCGVAAYYKTVLGVSLFGSVINISAPILFADRLYEEKRLTRLAASSITRVFSGCSAWSPFFGGMAAILTYVPGVSLWKVMIVCFPFAMTGLLVVALDTWFFKRRQLANFRGYPVQFCSLWVPASLSLLVIVLIFVAPDWSILTCISVAALTLSFAVVLARSGRRGVWEIRQHITAQLPRMANELLLFLVAGVLAEGLASVIATGQLNFPLTSFGTQAAIVLLCAMVVVSAFGVHPVVIVAGLTPLLLTAGPSPDLLAVVYLFAWSLGACASPLSGTHLVFQGRYQIPSWRGALWNWPYVLVMLVLACSYLLLLSVRL
jgi:hypothetical protein